MRPYIASLGIQRFDRTAALHDGRLQVPGVMVSQVLPSVSVTGLLNGTFDAAEIPLAHYVFLKSIGAPFTALPVFPDRLFLQQYIYTRPDVGITSLEDLRGRRVILPMYFMTSSIWHRGFLHDSAGVRAADVSWITTSDERDERMRLPPGVSVTFRRGSHLGLELLLDGTGDALMTEATPVIPSDRASDVVPLIPEVQTFQRDFFGREAIHPIVHVIALREDLVARAPDVVPVLCHAFDVAKQSSFRLLQNERMTALPLMRSYLDETQALFGDDPWPYGVDGRNGHELDRFLTYAAEQGFIQRPLEVEELFEEQSLTFPWSASMERGADLASMESLLGLVESHPPHFDET